MLMSNLDFLATQFIMILLELFTVFLLPMIYGKILASYSNENAEPFYIIVVKATVVLFIVILACYYSYIAGFSFFILLISSAVARYYENFKRKLKININSLLFKKTNMKQKANTKPEEIMNLEQAKQGVKAESSILKSGEIMNFEQIKQNFKVESSFWKFIGLSLITSGIYTYYWVIRLLETSSEKYYIDKNSIKTPIALVWSVFAINVLYIFFVEIIQVLIETGEHNFSLIFLKKVSSTLYWVAFLVSQLLLIDYAIHTKKVLEDVYIKNNINEKFNMFWTIIFGGLYFYYKLNRIGKQNENQIPMKKKMSDDEKIEKIKKLAELKDNGVLTEEEFKLEKGKLLS